MALWLRSVRRRPGAALGVFLIVTVASAASVAGPALVRAAEQSGLRSTLAAAPSGAYDIEIDGPTDNIALGAVVDGATAAASRANHQLFEPPLVLLRTQYEHRWRTSPKHTFSALAVSTLAGCVSTDLASGTCPNLPDEVLVSAHLGIAPHTRITIVGRRGYFTVSGSYHDGVIPQWVPGLGPDPVLSAEATLQEVDPAPVVMARMHLRVAALTLDELGAAAASLRAVDATSLRQSVVSAPTSTLPDLENAVANDRKVAIVVGLLTVVPLVLLCWYTLVLIMQLIAVVRSREWALGRLRGLPVGVWLRSLYREPVVLLAAGAVCGFAAGTAVTVATVHATMAAGTPVEMTRLPVLACFAGTVLGAALGVGIATARGARLPLATLLQQSAELSRLTRAGATVQVLVLAATVFSIVQLASSRQVSVGPGNLGVLLPGLLAAVLSLAAIRIGARIVQRGSARPPKSLRRLVIGRRLARNPALLGRYLIVAVATAVMVFTASLLAIMHRNVVLRADNLLGAAQVVHVHPVAPSRLMSAVAAADPSGRQAMAVEQLSGVTYGGTSRIVAVDTSRLADVSYWDPGWAGLNAARVRRLLDPPHIAPLALRGTSVTMTIADGRLRTAPFDINRTAPTPHPLVELVVLSDDHWVDVNLGRLGPGASTLHGVMPCERGCTVRRIEFVNDSDTLFSASATITGLSTERQPASTFAARLRTTADWQNNLVGAEPELPVHALPQGSARGLTVRLRDYTGESAPAVIPADGPPDVPVIAANAVDAQPLPAFQNAVDGAGLDAASVPMEIVGRAGALPSSVSDGVLADLAVIARFSDPAQSKASAQVWLSPSAPASIVSALHQAGLRVTSVDVVQGPTDRLLAAAPVRAVIASIAAFALLAILASVALGAGVALDSERRRLSVQVLRDAGIGSRAIDRLCFAEVAVPATAAVVLGVAAATVTLLVAGSRLPLFADAAGPPLATAPPWVPILAVVGALIAIVLVASAALAITVRRSVFNRSRA